MTRDVRSVKPEPTEARNIRFRLHRMQGNSAREASSSASSGHREAVEPARVYGFRVWG